MIVVHVEKLREAAKRGDQKGVVEAARAISSATSEVLKEAKEISSSGGGGSGGMGLAAISERLREATIAVISSARVVLKNSSDDVYAAQLDSAGVKVAETVSFIIFFFISFYFLSLFCPSCSH